MRKFAHLLSLAPSGVRGWAKRLVDDLNAAPSDVPVGTIALWDPVATLPQGWILANGAIVNTADYKALFIALGNTIGATFTLPNVTSPVGSRAIIKV